MYLMHMIRAVRSVCGLSSLARERWEGGGGEKFLFSWDLPTYLEVSNFVKFWEFAIGLKSIIVKISCLLLSAIPARKASN